MRIQTAVVVTLALIATTACSGGVKPKSVAGERQGSKSMWAGKGPVVAQAQEGDDANPATMPQMPETSKADERKKLPKAELTRDVLYKFLLAEIAGQRGNVRLAAKAYLELAQSTKDPRLAKRATEIAAYGRFSDLAQEAAATWLELEPDSAQAKQTLVGVLVNANKLSDAKPYLQKLLAADREKVGASFLQLHPLLARVQDKVGAYNLAKDLAGPYQDVPEAHFSVAQFAYTAEKFDAAQQSVGQALKLRPGWEPAALFNAQLLQRESNSKAIDYLQGFLKQFPQAREVRLNYARLLVAEKRIEPARAEFQRIEQEAPNNADVVVTIALLALQANDLDTAETKFKRAIDLKYRDPDTLRYYLGQVAEERKRYDDALQWYGKVSGGDQFVAAASRYAFILAKQNKVAEARAYLQKVEAKNPQQQVQLTQAEAQVLREAKSFRESFDLLGSALEQQPDHPDLLYDYAMAAEKIDKLDVLEVKLKRLIELRPDHAQAYNALGYTLADRNLRLKEAREFIEQALKLSPEDPFILDSMGWVHYRMGNYNEGLDYLKRAFAQRQDPEIAAHLGEVLWAQGKKNEAEQVWREALKSHPENDELRTTVKKFLN